MGETNQNRVCSDGGGLEPTPVGPLRSEHRNPFCLKGAGKTLKRSPECQGLSGCVGRGWRGLAWASQAEGTTGSLDLVTSGHSVFYRQYRKRSRFGEVEQRSANLGDKGPESRSFLAVQAMQPLLPWLSSAIVVQKQPQLICKWMGTAVFQ